MGCDIHAAIEYKEGSEWKAILMPNKYFAKWGDEKELTASVDIGRNYDVFAILGNVRNGSGFAGTDTGEGFVPMSDGRGVPTDISEAAKEALSNEHSATWVTLTDIMNYDWSRTTIKRGVVGALEFEEWDRCKEFNPWPKSWSGGAFGGGIYNVTNEEMRQFLAAYKRPDGFVDRDQVKVATAFGKPHPHTTIEWTVTYMDAAKGFWTAAMPQILKLGATHGFDNVRLVMDFDS